MNLLNFETNLEIINLKRNEGMKQKSFLLIKIFFFQQYLMMAL